MCRSSSSQYRGTDGSTRALQASMPPAMLWQAGTPCSRSQCATFKLRTPWWQKTINVASSALASSCCKLAGMSRMGINVAPSMRVMANSSGSRTSISASGSPASIRRWTSSGLVSIGRIVSLTNLRIAQRKSHSAVSPARRWLRRFASARDEVSLDRMHLFGVQDFRERRHAGRSAASTQNDVLNPF
jgi:hypothetical protein